MSSVVARASACSGNGADDSARKRIAKWACSCWVSLRPAPRCWTISCICRNLGREILCGGRRLRVPAEIKFQTKPQIAAALLARSQVHFDWVTADEEYGRDGAFLDALEQRGQRYLVEIPCDTTVWTNKPLRQTPDQYVRKVRDLLPLIPARSWQIIQLREGAKGPLVFEFARLRVWSVRHRRAGPCLWLLIRRSLEQTPEIKYYFSDAVPDTPLPTMAQVTGVRWRVEEFLEDAKGQLGMAQYEARSWTSWHHHMSLVALAHLYVIRMSFRCSEI